MPYEAAKSRGRAPAGKSGAPNKAPFGTHRLVITRASIIKSEANNDSNLALDYRIQGGPHDGREFPHSFLIDSDNEEQRLEGQAMLHDLRKAAGFEKLANTSDLVDCALSATVSRAGIRYGAAA